MKIDVLLISPPMYRLYGRIQGAPPLGIMYIARYLNSKGIPAKVYNADYEGGFGVELSEISNIQSQYRENLTNLDFEAWKAMRRIIRDCQPNFIGISVTTASYNSALNVVSIAKEECPNVKIILGGPHVSALPEEALSVDGVDVVVVGEGEETMHEVVTGKPYAKIEGICYKDNNGKIIKNPRRKLIEDIDKLPFPMLEDLIFEKTKKFSFTEIMASRGCPYCCIFCASSVIWERKLRLRSAENIYQEILFKLKKYKTKEIQFWDDSLTLDKERLRKVCSYIKGLKLQWSCQTRAGHVSKEIVKMMKDSGCVEIALGVESGNQKILDTAKKSQKVEDVIKACEIIKRHGLRLMTFFIIGLPGETVDSINDSAQLIKKINPDGLDVSIATPLPGTEFYDISSKNDWIFDKNWANYHFVGRDDSVVRLPTIKRDDLVKKYFELQKLSDDINKKNLQKQVMSISYLWRHITLKDIIHIGNLFRKIRVFYSIIKNN